MKEARWKMSREIKFRAWCKTEGWYNGERKERYFMENNIRQINLKPTENFPQGEFIGKLGIWCGIRESVLMQYIGINDKNGKEIYEGDIVRTNSGRICKVVWFSSPQYQGWDLIPIETKNPTPKERELWSDLEVIGNVYENVDLLKEVDW